MEGANPKLFSENPVWLSHLDHTGDIGIVIQAPDLKGLFVRAAWGMFSILTDLGRVEPRQSWPVSVEAPDRNALLTRWLSELNYRHVTRQELFCRFDVLDITEKTLAAEVLGEPVDPNRHLVYTEIKAVTFHGLRIEQKNGSWEAQIIFDM